MKDRDELRSALRSLAAAVAAYDEGQPAAAAEKDDRPLHWFHPFVNRNDADDIFVFSQVS